MLIDTPAQQIGTAALALSCGLAFWRGARPDKLGAAAIAAAWITTPLVERRGDWFQPQYGILVVDSLLLTVLIALALRSGRRWPVCAAAFQSFTVLTHLAFLVNPYALYRAYYYANFASGFLLLGALFAGVLLESRGMAPRKGRLSRRPPERRPA
jgi:hypothetical protein